VIVFCLLDQLLRIQTKPQREANSFYLSGIETTLTLSMPLAPDDVI